MDMQKQNSQSKTSATSGNSISTQSNSAGTSGTSAAQSKSGSSSAKSPQSVSKSGTQSKAGSAGSQSKTASAGSSGSSGTQSKSGGTSSKSPQSSSGSGTQNKENNTQANAQNDNFSVLNEIYQNATMGKQSISSIIPKVQDQNFKKELVNCYENYDQICSQSASEIIKLGDRPREKNPLTKAMMWGTINVSTLVDDSTSNIADLMIKGSHSNVNNVTRSLNQYSQNIDSKIKTLANTFLQNEQSSITNLQKFL